MSCEPGTKFKWSGGPSGGWRAPAEPTPVNTEIWPSEGDHRQQETPALQVSVGGSLWRGRSAPNPPPRMEPVSQVAAPRTSAIAPWEGQKLHGNICGPPTSGGHGHTSVGSQPWITHPLGGSTPSSTGANPTRSLPPLQGPPASPADPQMTADGRRAPGHGSHNPVFRRGRQPCPGAQSAPARGPLGAPKATLICAAWGRSGREERRRPG